MGTWQGGCGGIVGVLLMAESEQINPPCTQRIPGCTTVRSAHISKTGERTITPIARTRSASALRSVVTTALLAASVTLIAPGNVAQANPAGTDLVISQVYGGGGNSGATYTHDFVEIFNPTASSVSLAGMSIQRDRHRKRQLRRKQRPTHGAVRLARAGPVPARAGSLERRCRFSSADARHH